jgi:Ca2+-binding EF-hand superfamily protein
MSSASSARTRRRLGKAESGLSFTDDQVNELKEAFEFFDHDKDGSLSKDDIKKAVKELGMLQYINRR